MFRMIVVIWISNGDFQYIPSIIQSGWWFQPLWKIWVSWDDDIPNIWENKSHVPVTTNQQLYAIIRFSHPLELGIPYLFALHSRAQLGRLLLALVPSLQHDAFQAASWASRRSSRARAWAETKTWTWNHMENIWEKHGKIGGNQIYWDVMGFEKAKNEPREMWGCIALGSQNHEGIMRIERVTQVTNLKNGVCMKDLWKSFIAMRCDGIINNVIICYMSASLKWRVPKNAIFRGNDENNRTGFGGNIFLSDKSIWDVYRWIGSMDLFKGTF